MSEKEYKWSPQNPSPAAVAKVKDPMPVPNFCIHCGSPVRLGTHAEIYDGRSFGVWPYVYLCENKECGAYVGLHSFTNIPLGHLATEAERAARKSCKPAFEKLWKTGAAPMSRNAAYAWLAEALQIPAENCHFGMFGVERCELAKKLCKAKYRELVGSKEGR